MIFTNFFPSAVFSSHVNKFIHCLPNLLGVAFGEETSNLCIDGGSLSECLWWKIDGFLIVCSQKVETWR